MFSEGTKTPIHQPRPQPPPVLTPHIHPQTGGLARSFFVFHSTSRSSHSPLAHVADRGRNLAQPSLNADRIAATADTSVRRACHLLIRLARYVLRPFSPPFRPFPWLSVRFVLGCRRETARRLAAWKPRALTSGWRREIDVPSAPACSVWFYPLRHRPGGRRGVRMHLRGPRAEPESDVHLQ